jgi:hypothetical protein
MFLINSSFGVFLQSLKRPQKRKMIIRASIGKTRSIRAFRKYVGVYPNLLALNPAIKIKLSLILNVTIIEEAIKR